MADNDAATRAIRELGEEIHSGCAAWPATSRHRSWVEGIGHEMGK